MPVQPIMVEYFEKIAAKSASVSLAMSARMVEMPFRCSVEINSWRAKVAGLEPGSPLGSGRRRTVRLLSLR